MRKYLPTVVLLAALAATPRGLSYQVGNGFLRAVTSVFSHVSTNHVLSNVAVLLVLSRPWRAPVFRLFSIFLLGGMGGNMAVAVLSERPVLGASAGVLAVLAFETILGVQRRDMPSGLLLASTISVVVYTSGFRLSHLREGSSYLSHLTGVLAGSLCALLVILLASRRTMTADDATGR